MSSADAALQLIDGVLDMRTDLAKAALDAGAHVDGDGEHPLPFAPILGAAVADHAEMVILLLEHGADPNRPVIVIEELPDPVSLSAKAGERALHVASRTGCVEVVRLLVKHPRTDLDATDAAGCTPLMTTCDARRDEVCVEVVRLLLEAGADPGLADKRGVTPLHVMAVNNHSLDLVDLLYSKAPAMIHRCPAVGQTPLHAACSAGHEGMVSKLLSLGATQQPPDGSDVFPLVVAAQNGFVGVVRILISDRGTKAAGSDFAVANALHKAVCFGRAIILRLLLAVGGEERRKEWANTHIGGSYLLHYGAGFCCPAVVGILLEAGAAAAVCDMEMRLPHDIIGEGLGRDGVQVDLGKVVAIRRMLWRGAAYRARSWAWPSDEEAGVGWAGDSETAVAVLASPPAVSKPPPVVDVRIFRPKDKSGSKFFVTLISRYCAKC